MIDFRTMTNTKSILQTHYNKSNYFKSKNSSKIMAQSGKVSSSYSDCRVMLFFTQLLKYVALTKIEETEVVLNM